MRVIKFLLLLVVMGAIAAGGYMYAVQMGWDLTPLTAWFSGTGGTMQDGQQMHMGHQGHQMPASSFNLAATQNRTKLNQALTSLNQAVELVTNDPYAQITMPNRMSEYPRQPGQAGQAASTDKENITINVNPPAGQAAPGTAGANQTVLPNTAANPPAKDLPASVNIVFDQGKLEQVHEGIFKLSQAMMLINELNNDLADQSMMMDADPPNQQTLVMRYNLTLQNRNKLMVASSLLREATVLVNVNPYAPQSGYVFNTQKMQQLHQGITELAKGTAALMRISDDLNQQLFAIAGEMQTGSGAMNMSQMQHGGGWLAALGENAWMINLGMLIIILGLACGVLIMIQRLVRDIVHPAAKPEQKYEN